MRNIQLATASSLLLCALASCADQTASTDELARRHHSAPDAAAAPITPLAAAGSVSCYTDGAPDNACALPDEHCCFSTFTAQHNGECTSAACGWGTVQCDGPEDCGSGESCCEHTIMDPDQGITGHMIACQASACGAAPAAHEMCHPDGPPCANGGTCVTALGNDNDLPRALYICM